MAGYIKDDELIALLGRPTAIAIFDDDGDGEPDEAPMKLVIDRSNVRVAARMPMIYTTAPSEIPSAVSVLLKDAALDYAAALAFQRHPEYVKTNGEKRAQALYDRAEKTMDLVQQSTLRIPTNDNPPEPKPENIGGFVADDGPRLINNSLDGTTNAGDF